MFPQLPVHRFAVGERIEIVNAAVEGKLLTERRLGEALAAMEKQKPGEYQRLHDTTVAASLSDLGITKDQSHRWQKLAGIIVVGSARYSYHRLAWCLRSKSPVSLYRTGFAYRVPQFFED